MKKKTTTFILILIDWITAILSWACFYYLRKIYIEELDLVFTGRFFLGITLIPLFWLFIYLLQGTYIDARRLYRTKIIVLTFSASLIGTSVLFFLLLLDDAVKHYNQYYELFSYLFLTHFSFTLLFRFIYVTWIVKQIHKRTAGFKTLIIGGGEKALKIYDEVLKLPIGTGQDFIGFIYANGEDNKMDGKLPHLGTINNLESIIREYEVEEVIIALEKRDFGKIKRIISGLSGGEIQINVIPDVYDILSGSVKMSNIFGALMMNVQVEPMPAWQRVVKRLIDIIVSLVALIVLIPVFIVLAILVKLSSPGPIFFLQERIGRKGKPFKIIKFRTMYIDAEKHGPQLSSSDDPRITKIGRFMRKTRLDEFPQFWNVLKGEMSLVGPRPERQYYIDQIMKIEPQFLQLTSVRPGITSWGQVKYGYAETIDEMLDRMKYDLLYLKNRSLALDFKILL